MILFYILYIPEKNKLDELLPMEKYDSKIEQLMHRCYQNLSEKDRRHYAAVEAAKLGHGGITYIADLFGCSRQTVSTGLEELKKKI